MSAKHLKEFYLDGICEDATYNEDRAAVLAQSAQILTEQGHEDAAEIIYEKIFMLAGESKRFLNLWARLDEETK